MKKIESFTIDHTRLQKGVYVSRKDHVGPEVLTTFDLRLKVPNQEILKNDAIHTLEHLIATFVRNDSEYAHKIIYFGPMGCLTGLYLIVHGDLTSEDVLPLLKRAFAFVGDYDGDIPGVSAVECGTYKLHSLPHAKEEALAFLKVIDNATSDQLHYPI